jgi:hypothetical protein
MRLLKSIDIFGSSFQFTIFNSKQYKTKLGGLFSIILLILAVIFTFLFGRDMFYMDNPHVTVDYIIPPQYPWIRNLTADKFLTAWRVNDQDGIYGNYSDYLTVSLVNYSRNGTGKLYKTKMKSINCSELNITDTAFTSLFDPKDWNCMDLKDLNFTFGGDQDSDVYSSWRLQVFPCPTCTDLIKLGDVLGDSAYFEIIYPEFFYLSNENKNPLGIAYNMHDQRINIGIKKKDKIYTQNVTSIDDRGWMFKSEDTLTTLAVQKYVTDYDYFTLDYFLKNNMPLYECSFYLEKERVNYFRSFMKIQDLAAQVSGVINAILLVFTLLTNNFNIYKRNMVLFNEMFEFNQNEKK